ncbi:hypothetical protein HOLleu_35639 [Holothuria leucospilota]|uniref:Uncharacterized protein n=1 Tax=Holothuria leucospilota TaxID=206669 RepID=A0A9Q0YIS0_HOLLE|nr:hypothetical protein HOLleu_35639 [Holothuria leucospilota]
MAHKCSFSISVPLEEVQFLKLLCFAHNILVLIQIIPFQGRNQFTEKFMIQTSVDTETEYGVRIRTVCIGNRVWSPNPDRVYRKPSKESESEPCVWETEYGVRIRTVCIGNRVWSPNPDRVHRKPSMESESGPCV